MAAKPLGTRVQEQRRHDGLSQAALAQRVGISRNYLSQIERGQATNLSWQIRERLTTELGLTSEQAPGTGIAWEELPPGLAAFAHAAGLPADDIRMLAGVHYRGRRATTLEQWKLLYHVIRGVLAP